MPDESNVHLAGLIYYVMNVKKKVKASLTGRPYLIISTGNPNNQDSAVV
jgi:hypothetical protein